MNLIPEDNSALLQTISGLQSEINLLKKEANYHKDQAILFKAQLSAILNSSKESSIFSIDNNYCYIAFNEKHQSDIYIRYNTIISHGLNILDVIKDVIQKKAFKALADRALNGESFIEEFTDIEQGLSFEIHWNPTISENTIIGATAITMDVSQQKQNLKKIKKLKRLYATLSQINQTVVHISSDKELYQTISRHAVDSGEFDLAWVGLYDEATGKISPISIYGGDIDLSPVLNRDLRKPPYDNGLIATALRDNKVTFSEDIQSDMRMQHWLNITPFHAQATVPFNLKGKMAGILNLYSNETGFFNDPEEIRLLEEISLDISFALLSLENNRLMQQWADAFDNCAIGIALVQPGTNQLITCNRAYAEQKGYTKGELQGIAIFQQYPEEDLNMITEYLKTAFHKGFVQYEARKLRKDGSSYISQIDIVNVKGQDGEMLYYVATDQDITDRKSAEINLINSQEKHHSIIQTAMDGYWQASLEGRFLEVNDAFEKMSGYSKDELLAMSISDLDVVENKDGVNAHIRKIVETGSDRFETILRRKDGSSCDVEVSVQHKIDENNLVVFIHDISERKRYENEILALNANLEKKVEERTEQLQISNKELEAFSYSVSHDLRAPLRAIDGFTRIFIEKYRPQLDEEGIRLGNIIRENTGKMSKLIEDLLVFSRLSRQELVKSRIDMKGMVVAMFHEITGESERNKIKFIVHDICDTTGDPNLMRQVWANLLSNAIKYSAKVEQPEIHVRCEMVNNDCVYQVQDNGAGFDMAYADKLFKVFQRLHSPRDFDGTGVGLASVHRIIHRHGGKIWADSAPGKGARFFFTLP